MKWSRHIIYVSLMLLFAPFTWAQQTEDDIRDEANKLFEQEKYVQATPLFLQLTSLNPKDYDYNFKYGTCLLFNSNQKSEGLRYLNYAIKDPDIDKRAYYFRGRALHLDYQFDLAKKSYQRYLKEAGKSAREDYETERYMEMCDNGKRLLTQFTDIIVAEKKEIDQDKFFRIYTDAETVKGYILVSEQFQSKIDKKKGFIPIVHFPPDASAVYYASYGDDESTGLDIYVRKRLPDGTWGMEQKLPGEVNTQYDENFPYLHPSGRFLYFSSKGHNSMGGYDIFMSRYRDETEDFGPPENVDFAISSPDDDLFYVVDSLFQNAYFASSRQSEDGKLHVYRVKVVRVPIQEVIVMGDFESTINPASSRLFVKLTEAKSGKQVAETESNAENKYAIVFPQGGKYNYEIEITTSQEIRKFTVEIPFQDELRPLKQKILHTMEDGHEVVKILNMFDEEVEGAEEIIAQLIRKKAELDVNIENFDMEKVEAEQRKNEILAELGFKNMRPDEITDQILELENIQKQNETQLNVIKSNVEAAIIQKSEEITKLKEEQRAIENKIATTEDQIKKHELLSLAKQKEYEIRATSDQITSLKEFSEETASKMSKGLSSTANVKDIADHYMELVTQGEELQALKYLKENQTALKDIRNSSPEIILENLISERVAINNELDRVKYEEGKMDRAIDRLQSEINILESKLTTAKKKEIPQIEADISSKKREIENYKEEKKYGEVKKKDLSDKINRLDSQISTMQKAIKETEVLAVNEDLYKEALKQAEKNLGETEETKYDQELLAIEQEYPELTNNTYSSNKTENVAAISEIKRENSSQEQKIQSNNSLSEAQKLQKLIDNIDNTLESIESRMDYLNSELAVDPDNQSLKDELNELQEYKIRQDSKKNEYERQLEELNSVASTTNGQQEEELTNEIMPDYQSELTSIDNNEDLTELGKTEAKLKIEQQFEDEVRNDLNDVNEQLEADPNNQELKQKQAVLNNLLESSNERVQNLEEEANELIAQETGHTSEQGTTSNKELVNELVPTYENQYKEISENSSMSELEKEQSLLQLEEELKTAAEEELSQTQKDLQKDPENAELKARENDLQMLIAEKEEAISEKEQVINALQGESSVADLASIQKELINQIDPDFENKINELRQNERDIASIDEQISLNEKMISSLEKELKAVQKQLKKDPENKELLNKEKAIQQLISEFEKEVQSLQNQKTVLANEQEIFANNSQEIENIYPGYDQRVTELEAQVEQSPTFGNVSQLQREDQELLTRVEDRLDEIDQSIEENGSTPELTKEKEQLELVKQALENRIDDRIEQLNTLSQEAGIANVDEFKEEIRNNVEPDYENKVDRIKEAGLSEVEEAELMIELEKDVLRGLKDERQKLLDITAREPNNEEAKVKLQVVNDLIQESEEKISALNNIMQQKENIESAFENAESIINDIAPNYTSEKKQIEANEELTELAQLVEEQQLDNQLLNTVKQELASVSEELDQNPGDAQLREKKEKLEVLENAIETQIGLRSDEIEQLKASETQGGTSEDNSAALLNELGGDYSSEIEKVNSSSVSETDKAIQRLSLHQELAEKLSKEADRLEREIEKSPASEELKTRLATVESLQQQNERSISEERTLIQKDISSTERGQKILKSVDPTYSADIAKLESSESATKYSEMAERESALQAKLLNELEKKKEKLKKSYSVDVDVEILALEKLIEESKAREADFMKKNADVAINNGQSEESNVQLEKTLSLDAMPEEQRTYVQELRDNELGRLSSEIEKTYTDKDGLDKQNAILSRYERKLEDLASRAESGELELSESELVWLKNEQEQLATKRAEIKEALANLESGEIASSGSNQEQFIDQTRNDLLGSNKDVLTQEFTTAEQLNKQDEALSSYESALENKLETIRSSSDFNDNQQLQEEAQWIENELETVRKKRRSIQISIGELETNVMASNEQEEATYIEQKRAELLGQNEKVVEENYTTEAELEQQDRDLAVYEEKLNAQIEEIQNSQEFESSDKLKEEVNWLEKEVERVQKKRKSIYVTIGELKTEVLADNTENDPVIKQLNQEETQLNEVLNDPSASEAEKEAAENRIAEVKTERTERENEVITEEIKEKMEEQQAVSSQLNELAEESGNQNLQTLAESAESRQEQVVALVNEAEKAGTPEEKQYILNQAAAEQEKLNSDIEDVVIEEKVAQIENENQVELDSKEELEKKKRRFMVEIGDLTMEIKQTDEEINSAKKKDRVNLEKKKESLEDERDLVQDRLQHVNEQLEAIEESAPVISERAMEQEISFNEERKLAATDEYKAYSEKAEEALELEEQITTLENEINDDRMALKALLERLAAGEGIQSEVDEKVVEIKEKQTLLEQKQVELIQKKYTAEQLLPEDEEKAMKLQNLAIRGVKPIQIQTTAIAMAMLSLPTDGLAIKSDAESIYSEANPIPVNIEAPKGLVYRVQIGAFRNKIPQDLFSEFNPVTGELIGSTGITRYMAGFFASSDKVVQAREQIRGLGYDDAFVVAYCDGKRVGFGDARRMEEAGTCVPQGESNLMMEVAGKIAEEMGLPIQNEVEELPDYSYAQAPGAAPSQPIELTTGLFYTVQIGVFSKPVTKHDLLEMEELFTIRLANGTIRYNSGMFNSIEEAKVRKKIANERGIKAFVTAYFEGERISIEEAEQLLAARGQGILQTKIAPPEDGKTTEYEVPDHIVRTDSVQTGAKNMYSDETFERMQIVTKKSFDEFPRDVLNRYNAKGTFYYDRKDGKVKSVVTTNPVHLPRVYKFRHDVDTVYLDRIEADTVETDIVKFTTLSEAIPGDLMDWLMRFNYRREFTLQENKYLIRLYGVEPENSQRVMDDLRGFGYNPSIEELTEDELELKETE